MSKELEIQQLISYVSGNCSAEEQKTVEAWVKLSPDNELLYADYQRVWESTSARKQSVLVDVDNRWEEFKKRAKFDESLHKESTFSFKHVFIQISRVAAVIAILFTAWFMFDKEQQPETVYYSSNSIQVDNPYMLPDGSKIQLNSNAELSHPEFYASDTRDVNFSGEAFFNIAHNPEKPLIVSTDNVRVKVLGTSFNLCNCSDSDEITVYLESGKILFYSIGDTEEDILEQVILTPGEMAVYSKTTGMITKSYFTGNNHTAWKSGILEFVNAPLTDVVKVIEKTYGVTIDCELPLNDYHLTARFENESASSVFETLQILYGFNCDQDSGNVSIK